MAEQSSLVRLQDEFDLTVDWRGFELHPETPVGGMALSALFPGRSIAAMHEQLRSFAADFGIRDLVTADWLPNTRRALAIAELARDLGKLEAWRTTAMNAYWRAGVNLEGLPELRRLASEAGLDADAAVAAMDDPSYLERIDATRREASALGIRGIPTFVVGDLAVVGCQPVEVLRSVARRAGVASRREPPASA